MAASLSAVGVLYTAEGNVTSLDAIMVTDCPEPIKFSLDSQYWKNESIQKKEPKAGCFGMFWFFFRLADR